MIQRDFAGRCGDPAGRHAPARTAPLVQHSHFMADKGKAIRDALDAGSAAVASKLAEDIQRAPPPPAAKKKK